MPLNAVMHHHGWYAVASTSAQGSSSCSPALVSVRVDKCRGLGPSTSLPVTLLGRLCKQGFRGFKGEKGEPGQPGLDGLDAPCQLVQYFSFSSTLCPCMQLTFSHRWKQTMHVFRARQSRTRFMLITRRFCTQLGKATGTDSAAHVTNSLTASSLF